MPVMETSPAKHSSVAHATVTLDITVLAGGPGGEREVSLQSGRSVFDALAKLGHQVQLWDIGPGDLAALDRPADFVFIALHGEFGEDGTVQALLDERGLIYSGTGARASRLAMDKVQSKRLFEQAGIATPSYEVVDAHNLRTIASRVELPVVVKPVSSGSSVDTTIVRDGDALQESAASLVEKYGSALIEKYIAGPELTVGILGQRALPVCEIRTRRAFYDYQAKYLDDDTEYLFDIALSEELQTQVQRLSLQAHRLLGCEVFSRVDWMIDEMTQQPYVLEINTIPGFTAHSLLPKAAVRVGINFDALCSRIVELSLQERQG